MSSATACTSAGASDEAGTGTPALDPASLVPSVAPATVRRPAEQLDPVPAPGTVGLEEGPFTDRLAFKGLSLQGGTRVVGRVTNTADISALIVLELQADFYDGAGRLLGSGTRTYADGGFIDSGATAVEVGPDDTFSVSVTSRPAVAGAVSAVLTVPQLVNE